MPINFACPACGKVHRVPDSSAGKTGKCKCGARLQVPKLAPAIKRFREERDRRSVPPDSARTAATPGPAKTRCSIEVLVETMVAVVMRPGDPEFWNTQASELKKANVAPDKGMPEIICLRYFVVDLINQGMMPDVAHRQRWRESLDALLAQSERGGFPYCKMLSARALAYHEAARKAADMGDLPECTGKEFARLLGCPYDIQLWMFGACMVASLMETVSEGRDEIEIE